MLRSHATSRPQLLEALGWDDVEWQNSKLGQYTVIVSKCNNVPEWECYSFAVFLYCSVEVLQCYIVSVLLCCCSAPVLARYIQGMFV